MHKRVVSPDNVLLELILKRVTPNLPSEVVEQIHAYLLVTRGEITFRTLMPVWTRHQLNLFVHVMNAQDGVCRIMIPPRSGTSTFIAGFAATCMLFGLRVRVNTTVTAQSDMHVMHKRIGSMLTPEKLGGAFCLLENSEQLAFSNGSFLQLFYGACTTRSFHTEYDYILLDGMNVSDSNIAYLQSLCKCLIMFCLIPE